MIVLSGNQQVTVCLPGVFLPFLPALHSQQQNLYSSFSSLYLMRPVQVSDYKPVSCEAHSIYELAVMQRKTARVRWQDDDGGVIETRLQAIDVETKNREEFLIARTSDSEILRIRLDRILSFEPEI